MSPGSGCVLQGRGTTHYSSKIHQCNGNYLSFADASGSGFGSILLIKGNIHYRTGTWSSKKDTNSSN